MGIIKFRLRRDNKIVGYEKWYSGYQKECDPCSANPCWLYSKDNKFWTPHFVPYHNYKDLYAGLKDKNNKVKEIYEGDIVYLAGHGNYIVEFPFTELYEAMVELDIGAIIGNRFQNPELAK